MNLRRILAACALSMATTGAWATAYLVDSTADNTSTDGALTLREAVEAASTNTAVGDAPAGMADGDIITFSPALNGATINLALGELQITDDLAIDATLLLGGIGIDAGGNSRVFLIDSVEVVSLTNLALTNGSATSGGAITTGGGTLNFNGGSISNSAATGTNSTEGGGAIYSSGATLNVTGSSFSGNTATNGSGSGGAIFNGDGNTLMVTGSTFSANSAARAGGAIEDNRAGNGGTFTVGQSDFIGNSTGSNPGNGGAIHVSGSELTAISGGTVLGNTAAAEGGGFWNNGGTMTVTNVNFGDGTMANANVASGTDAGQGGGALFNNGGILNVDGGIFDFNIADGSPASSGGGSGGAILNDAGDGSGMLTVSNATINNNTAVRAGGGIEGFNGADGTVNIDVDATDFTGNSAGVNGGAIHITGAGDTTVDGGSALANLAAQEGGGFWNGSGTMTVTGTAFGDGTMANANVASGSAAGQGGGALFNNGGTLNVQAGTVINFNIADGAAPGGSGGGILNEAIDGSGTLQVMGATLSNNTAVRAGGAIEGFNGANGTTNISTINTDFTGNSAGVNGGAIHVTGPGDTSVSGGTVLANVAGQEGGGFWNGSGNMTVSTTDFGDGTMANANIASGSDAGQGGGALFNNGGTLNVSGATIDFNIADGAAPGGSGGGILNDAGMGGTGTLTVTGTTIDNNTAVRAGGGIEGFNGSEGTVNVDVDATNFAENSAGVNGGAIHITGAGDSTIDGGSVLANTAAAEGGGFWNGSGVMTVTGVGFGDGTMANANVASGTDAGQGGGALFNNGGTLIVDGGTFNLNIADGAPASSGGGSGGAILNDAGDGTGTLTVSNATISNNTAIRAGGGIEGFNGANGTVNINVDDTDFSGNSAGVNGGAIHITGPGDTTIDGGLVLANTAAQEGGGFWNGSGSMIVTGTNFGDGSQANANVASGIDAGQGGGALFNNGGSLRVVGSLFNLNVADGASPGGSGGAILNDAGTNGTGTLTVVGNTGFVANTATRAGGAIEGFNGANGTVNITTDQANFINNTADINGGAVHITGPGDSFFGAGFANGNVALLEGGAFWNGTGKMTVDNYEITGNTASGPGSDQGGGGLFNAGGTLIVANSGTVDKSVEKGSPPVSTIANNVADGESGSGGGILSDGGSVSVASGVTIVSNTAKRAGGGVELASASGTFTDVDFTSNSIASASPGDETAPGNGGALHAGGASTITIVGGTYDSNTAVEGGGIWTSSDTIADIENVVVTNNTATGTEDNQGGGGVFNLGTMTFSGDISNNVANGDGPTEGGGAFFNNGDLTITNSNIDANTAVDGSGNGGAIFNTADGSVELIGSTVEGNQAARAGGAIESAGSLDVTNTMFAGNTTGINGGVLHITGSGTAQFTNSDMMMNNADNEGGGIWVSDAGSATVDRSNVDNNTAAFGGGLFVDAGVVVRGLQSDRLVVRQSAVVRNTSTTNGGGLTVESGSVLIDNSTFSENSSVDGGAVHVGPTANVVFTFATVAANDASGMGGGINNGDGGSVNADNTIVANNEAPSGPDVQGDLTSNDYLVVGDSSNAVISGTIDNSSIDVDPRISGLADNGGDTFTHALLPASPALDSADQGACPAQDQRTFARTDGACDIGAYEDRADSDIIFQDGFEMAPMMR